MNPMSLPDQVPFTDDQGGPNYRRASKACIPCREKKVKCHLGPLDRPGQPPCIKCRRSGRFCYFDDKTRGGQRKKARKDSNANTNAPSNLEPAASSLGPEVTQGEIHSIPNPVLIERESTMLNENDPLALSELRNSGDTFNMLAAAASKTSPVRNASIAVISPSLSSLSDQITKDTKMVWGKCIFVQNKFLTRSEAIELVTFYYIALADIGPFANTEYVDPNKYDKLVNEDILLLGAILTVASRLHPIPGIDGWSRSKLIHKRMWKWTKNEISSVVFGGRNLDKVGLGIVEACLLLSEWAPRDVLEGEDDHDSDQSTTMSEDEGNGEDGPRRDLKVVLEGAYRTDRFSWIMTGTAHTLLQHFISQTSSNQDADRLQRNKFLCYTMISNISRRLGQSSMVSMDPLESQRTARAEGGQSFLKQEQFLELLKILHSAHLIFYPDKETTRKLIEQGRHLALFRWFQSIMRSWISKIETGGDSFGAIQIALDYEYLLLYVYSLSLQAIALSRTHNVTSVLPRPPVETSGPSTSDQSYVLLAFEAAKNVIRLTMDELTRFVSLSHLSARYLCKIVFSASFLIKVMYIGGIDPSVYPETIAFLEKVIESLQTTASDDLHPALRYGYLIQILLQNIKTKFIASRRASPVMSSDEPFGGISGDFNFAFDLPEGMEPFAVDGNPFDFSDIGSWEELVKATGLEEPRVLQ